MNYGQNYNMMWQDTESAGPENDDFSDYIHNRGPGFRRGGFGRNPPGFFGAHGPPGHGPRFMWGRGFGPGGPPMPHRFTRENDTIGFLMRCGVMKQNLKGLPKALLRLMEPEYCGICAQTLDNIDMTRMHYISKNHTKNQKKWLTRQAEVGSHRAKEIPLKSRDLYCELCDVHITSKAHADAHYAGKPHRAIVEGRRGPKNPFLVQNGMKERVEQLIRREKKFLKAEKSEKTVEVKNESNPAGAIPPELYCNICKTSVTCSEQMTMHLNGKKHLSKEKQHILKTMKSGTETNPADAPKDGDAQEGHAPESNSKQQPDCEENYDWGQGSGTWDDDPQ